MDQSDWRPELAYGTAPMWSRLTDRLEADIGSGVARPGMKLPPHRELAHRLGLAVGTVSRAYSEAERRGLVESHVGRGTFVTHRPAIGLAHRQAEGRINLGMNVPPVGPALGLMEQTFDALRQRRDLGAIFDYTSAAGLPGVREAGAAWLRGQLGVMRANADRMIQTNGGQHALMLACSSFARAGDSVLCDLATYPGNRTIADHGGWRLHGIAADEHGMDPAMLDRAAAETGARLLMLIPTLHNPTAITMNAARRAEIVEVARARDLIIIEDDIYRVFGRDEEPAPLADLAPERVIYVTSLSKALSPGLRLGFLLAPDDDAIFQRLLLAAQATLYCPPAAGGLIFSSWTESGHADRILREVRVEMSRRNALARQILGDKVAEAGSTRSLHLWLPMAADRASQVYARALKANVDLTPPDAPFPDPAAISGLRICLGNPLEIAELEQGLQVVAAALAETRFAGTRSIV